MNVISAIFILWYYSGYGYKNKTQKQEGCGRGSPYKRILVSPDSQVV